MLKYFEWLVEFMFPTYKVEEFEVSDHLEYYVTFRGDRVMEFESLEDAKDYADMMNEAYFGVSK